MKVILFMFLATMAVFSGFALAKNVERIDLIRSADLFRITNLSMHYESMQYSLYSQWRVVADELATKRLARDQARDELARIQKLFDQGIANENDLRRAELDFSVAESELGLQQARVLTAAAEVRRYQLLMLAEGNPEDDYRKLMAKNLKEKYQAQLSLLQAKMGGARGTLRFYIHQLEITRQLFEKGFRTKSQLERWEFLVQNQRSRMASIEHQQSSAREGMAGAALVLERL